MKCASARLIQLSKRMALLAVMGVALSFAAGRAYSCEAGEEACPAILQLNPGSFTLVARREVSVQKPRYYFKFKANAGQEVTIRTSGGGLKTGAGFPLTFPDGESDAIMEGEPYKLPQSGDYVVVLMANLMSEGPFGHFKMTLRIK